MALPNGGPFAIFLVAYLKKKLRKIQFSFKDKRLEFRVWTEECGDKPTVYTAKKSLKVLIGDGTSKTFDWNNETLVNYFMNLSEMARHLNSRVEQPWREFLNLYLSTKLKLQNFPTEETIGSCLYKT